MITRQAGPGRRLHRGAQASLANPILAFAFKLELSLTSSLRGADFVK